MAIAGDDPCPRKPRYMQARSSFCLSTPLFLRLLLSQIPEPAWVRNQHSLYLILDIQKIVVSGNQDIGFRCQGRRKDNRSSSSRIQIEGIVFGLPEWVDVPGM